jgi:hypothetical protein
VLATMAEAPPGRANEPPAPDAPES